MTALLNTECCGNNASSLKTLHAHLFQFSLHSQSEACYGKDGTPRASRLPESCYFA